LANTTARNKAKAIFQPTPAKPKTTRHNALTESRNKTVAVGAFKSPEKTRRQANGRGNTLDLALNGTKTLNSNAFAF